MLIQKLLKNPIIQALLAPLLLGVLAYIGKEYLLVFYHILAKQSATLLLDSALLSVTLNVILLFWLIIAIKGKSQEKINAFGVKWDQDQNAYCPKCEILIADYGKYEPYDEVECFRCKSCSINYLLKDKRGNRVDLSGAVDFLEKGKVGLTGFFLILLTLILIAAAVWFTRIS